MNQSSGNNPHAPQSGQTLVQGGPPQYVTASPPGVAVALPNSQYPQPQAAPAHPQYQQPYGQQPQYAQQQQAAPAQPAQPRPAGRQDELIANAGRTVYEFRGDHSEEARSRGRHQTFFADDANLASIAITEERHHSNLKGGGVTTWLITGLVILVVGGLTAFFVSGSGSAGSQDAETEEVANAEAQPAAAPAEATPPTEATPPVETPPADGTAEGAAPPAVPAQEEAKPAEPAQPEEAKPAEPEETKPAEEPKKSSTTKKKSSSSTKKKTEPEPARKVPSIAPSKPPRDSGLDGLPAPD